MLVHILGRFVSKPRMLKSFMEITSIHPHTPSQFFLEASFTSI